LKLNDNHAVVRNLQICDGYAIIICRLSNLYSTGYITITIFEGVDGGTSVKLVVVVVEYYLQLIYYQQHL
jgi:hypothetical protein